MRSKTTQASKNAAPEISATQTLRVDLQIVRFARIRRRGIGGSTENSLTTGGQDGALTRRSNRMDLE